MQSSDQEPYGQPMGNLQLERLPCGVPTHVVFRVVHTTWIPQSGSESPGITFCRMLVLCLIYYF